MLLLPTWSVIHSRHWKMQIPYLARHCRVVTFDGRGNGRSDRPRDAAAYDEREFAADAIAVMDDAPDRTCRDRRLLAWRPARLASRSRAARTRRRRRLYRAELSRRRLRTPRANRLRLRRESTSWTKAGRSTTGSTGCATTAIGSSSSCRRVSRSLIRRSRSRMRSGGRSRRTPRRWPLRKTGRE